MLFTHKLHMGGGAGQTSAGHRLPKHRRTGDALRRQIRGLTGRYEFIQNEGT